MNVLCMENSPVKGNRVRPVCAGQSTTQAFNRTAAPGSRSARCAAAKPAAGSASSEMQRKPPGKSAAESSPPPEAANEAARAWGNWYRREQGAGAVVLPLFQVIEHPPARDP